MNNQEKLKIWKTKIIILEKEIKKLENHHIILSNISNEIKSKQNPKLEISLEWTDLEDEISYLKDWIEYHQGEISKYDIKINELKAEKDNTPAETLRSTWFLPDRPAPSPPWF